MISVFYAATAVSFIPQIPARAEEAVRYPYVMFAGSADEGAITINSNNVCINGSIATNGTISTTAQNFNVNGSRTENAQESMKFFFDKIESRYFTSHVDTYFEKKYIKVIETANSGKVGESVAFVVISTEDGYDIEVLDSDEDGLPDIYELKIGTAPYDQDTDDDGLTDYQEYVYTQTDPLVYDSVTEGVSDADIDTDEDGLSDYDEIFVYNTDPLIADSDEDGVDDGSEIKLGLDPNDPATNGVPDGEYVIPQAIAADSSILSTVNTAESPYELSIDIKTNGDAEKELNVDESGYSAAIENDAMLRRIVLQDIHILMAKE